MSNALISPDTERTVLGLVLMDNEHFPEVASLLVPDDFGLDSNRKIFRAMSDITEAGMAIDPITLKDRLIATRELGLVGGYSYISSLTESLPYRAKVEQFCRIVKDRSRRRKFRNVCEIGISAIEDGEQITGECVAAAQSSLMDIEADTSRQTVLHVGQVTDKTFADLQEHRERSGGIIGRPTGLVDLDRATDGIRDGELWYVGARPGRGKSALATQVLEANALDGTPVLMFSIEMTRGQLLRRLWARVAKVPFRNVKDPRRADEYEWQCVSSAAGSVSRWPFFIDDSSSINIDELVSRAILSVKRQRVGLVIVDYVQRVESNGDTEIERITNVSKKLSRLAKDYVPVLALSQMPRAPEHNINKIPNMQDLKGSSDLEQDAHVILLLHRPVDQERKVFTGEDLLIIEKQREGEIGPLYVTFDEDKLIFKPRSI